MKTSSIRTRLAVWHTAVLGLALVIFSATTWLLVHHFLQADLKRELLDQLTGLKTYLAIEEEDPNTHIAQEIDEYSRSLPRRHVLVVYDAHHRLVYTTNAGAGELNISPRDPFEVRWNKETFLAAAQTLPTRNGAFLTLLALPAASVQRIDSILAIVLSATVPAFILAGGVGGLWLSRKALAPVDAITNLARAIGVGNLSERLPAPGTGDELERLTLAWNEMLERLERAVREMQQFTADASHELRTPVAIIQLAAENALRRNRSEQEYRDALQQVVRQSESMTGLLADLLTLARASTDRPNPPALIDLNELIDSAVAELNPIAEARQIVITQTSAGALPKVAGDTAQSLRLLRILLDNAIKYSPPGGRVEVSANQSNGHAAIRVTDTGIGIPAEFRERIFERFFRVDPSRNRDTGGFGLGLSIAASIAREHSAAISVTANPAGGSVFVVSFPVAEPL